MKHFLYTFLKFTVTLMATTTVFIHSSNTLYAGSGAMPVVVQIVGPDTACVYDVSTYSTAIERFDRTYL